MVAGPAMIYKINESVKQIPYPWTVQPMHNQGTKHGKSKKLFTTWKDSSIPHGPEVEKGRIFLVQILDRIGLSRGAQQLLIYGLRFEIWRPYFLIITTLAECFQVYGLNVDQILFIILGFLLYEIKNCFTEWNPSATTANTLQSCLSTILSLIFDIQQKTSTLSKPAYITDPDLIASLFWQPDGQPADKRRISLWLNSLSREIDIFGATAYSFKHVASKELA
ncbi:MAG: hypothetical protein EZS28_027442 [Streblomastix strix]|uniref:Uncharacterized protein n=1 Tax=Streblomastix strix TaxID=222440 RepID=A0A5J4V3P5_9EUKA|nr:MAG: hypothetical protein EZS28_027442 [Streblomastix strix]